MTPEHTITGADVAKVNDYSFVVTAGKTSNVPLTAGSLSSDKAPVSATTSGTINTQFFHLQGRYSVDYELDLTLSLPTFPFDARHDVGELHVIFAMATVKGASWDVNSENNGFVVTVDVADVLTQAVGVASSIVVSRPIATAVYKVAGLVLQDVGSIRFGCKWAWYWQEEWGKQIEYVVNVFSSFRTYARSIYLKPVLLRHSSEASDPDGDCDAWTLVPMDND